MIVIIIRLLVSTSFLYASVQSARFGVNETQQFDKGTLCDLNDRLSHQCSKQDQTVRPGSLLECSASCGPRELCNGVSLDEDGNCFLHRACPKLTGCTVPATDHNYFVRKRCDNGGQFNEETESCACVDSWVGPSCQDRPRSCSDLITSGYPSGKHNILLDPDQKGKDLHRVVCTIYPSRNYHYVNVLRHTGNIDFNLTWHEYTNGFYRDNVNLWIGLDHWRAVGEIGYTRLLLVLEFGDKGKLSRRYDGFRVHGSFDGFSYSHEEGHWEKGRGEVNDAGNKILDCFGPYQNTAFSTWDNDNDNDTGENCPALAGFGWWFKKGCDVKCNLFGWGESHKGSKPANQILSVDGIDLDKWLPELVFVSIFVAPE